MEYHLPFVGADGKHYELTGIKHMPGDKCLGVLTQITTLYCHVRPLPCSIYPPPLRRPPETPPPKKHTPLLALQ